MEKSHTDFLQEMEAELAGLKERIAALEGKLAAFKADETEPQPNEEVDFTDVDLEGDALGPSELGMTDIVVPPETEAIQIEAPAPDIPEEAPFEAEADQSSPAPAVPDETADLPWRKDRPGMQVKNIRSGISLYDRALFIGTLFKEDYALYDKTIADINAMGSLNQAVDYIREHFPSWNLKSDVVYHFMMCIRKKLG